ncbi:hypothetical protein KUV26_03645 [Leisingera daeponensis]|uniref:Uncharacterized protein n=1 Tax=Leisingera daeponensis TaxID=405746 RepID=A0ABS7NCN6_9RHOB|nr:hypothetical protein [Leisingera daeponensis]MBY6138519.1 hypothetical protein [Leisingera daeponensis]
MSATATFYLKTTGEILRANDLQDVIEILECLRDGEDWVTGAYSPQTHYVVGGAAAERPAVPVPAGSVYDLSQLPVGAKLTVTDEEGYSTVLSAQQDILELVDAGSYRLRSVSPFPYLDFDVEVTV